MRVGIHVGKVVGGVTGSNIVRYDIYGPGVMIANKMESNGAPGRILVSGTTKRVLEVLNKEIKFEFNQHIDIKLRKKEVDSLICMDSFFIDC